MLFLFRQVMQDPLALEILRKSLPTARSLLRAGIAGYAAAGIVVRVVVLDWRFGLLLPCLQ